MVGLAAADDDTDDAVNGEEGASSILAGSTPSSISGWSLGEGGGAGVGAGMTNGPGRE